MFSSEEESLMNPGSVPTFDGRNMKTTDQTRLELDVVHASNPGNKVAEAGGLWSRGQSGVHAKILFLKAATIEKLK